MSSVTVQFFRQSCTIKQSNIVISYPLLSKQLILSKGNALQNGYHNCYDYPRNVCVPKFVSPLFQRSTLNANTDISSETPKMWHLNKTRAVDVNQGRSLLLYLPVNYNFFCLIGWSAHSGVWWKKKMRGLPVYFLK